MLQTLDGKPITKVPHAQQLAAVKKALGVDRTNEIQNELNRIIDSMPPDPKTARRTFSSSFLGSELTPWQAPLVYLYYTARQLEAANATEKEVQDRAALLFGLFVWECIMDRNEEWAFYDPNLNSRDPNREITGKVYFERS